MCLALIAIGQHPQYPLIILSNRDEFYNRATAPAHYWQETPYIFAGKDLVADGAWLGVNTTGSFGLITNYRDPDLYDPAKRSRGLLVKNYLSGKATPSNYIKSIAKEADNYNPFNLLLGTSNDISYFSNQDKKEEKLKPGLYGISNHLLNTPWFKVNRAKELFINSMNTLGILDQPEDLAELLLPILHDRMPAPNNLLPNTGVGLDLEKALSSIFVEIPEHAYGTRSSTLILFKTEELFFVEKAFMNNHTESLSKTHIPFIK